MVTIFIPTMLQQTAGGTKTFQTEARTVRDALNALEEQYPELAGRLQQDGRLKSGLSVVVNSSISPRGLHTRVQPGDEIHFLTSVGGG